MKKRALLLSLFGFVLGCAIGAGIMLLESADGAASFTKGSVFTTVLYLFSSGLYGAVNMGTSVVYGIERWGVLRCTVTHFCIVIAASCAFFGLLIAVGWMAKPPLGVCLLMAGLFVAVYFVIWLGQYLRWHHEVRRLNEDLEKIKSSRGEDK